MIRFITAFFLLVCQYSLLAQNQAPFTTFMGTDCHWGLLDKNKKEILPSQYIQIQSLEIGNNWLITAQKEGTADYFLYQNDKIVPLNYPEVEKVNDRLLKVGEQGAYGLITTEGKGLLLMNNDNILFANSTTALVEQKGLWGAVDLDGKILIKTQYLGLYAWETGGFWGKQEHFQLLDFQGKEIKNALYDSIKIAATMPIFAVKAGQKWGVIDAQNQIRVPFDYLDVELLESGAVAVLDETKQWHLLNLNGDPITENTFDAVKDFKGKAILVTKNGQQGLVDNKGAVLLEPSSAQIDYLGKDWFGVFESKAVRIFNILTKQFLDKKFEAIKYAITDNTWTGILFQQNKKWGWMDFDEHILINPTFTQVAPYQEYILVTSEDNKVGLISVDGQSILPAEYKVITPKQAFFKVKKEVGDWYFVDKNNKKLNCSIF